MPVALIVKLTAKPGQRDALVDALGDLALATEDEPGTLQYVLNTDLDDADAVWFYEAYADDAALAAHSTSPAMKAAGPKLAELLAGRMEIHRVAPVRGKNVPG